MIIIISSSNRIADTIFLAEPFDSHAIELTLFLWHMPANTTETVAEHSASCNHQSTCMPQPLFSAAPVPNVLP